jgi:hypothetical protein
MAPPEVEVRVQIERPRADQKRFEQAAHDPSPEAIAWPIRARRRLVVAGEPRPVIAGDVGDTKKAVG